MGFSYKDWKGVFYPADTASRNYLAYYSRVFNATEVDSTFYGTPKLETVQNWAATTPEDFKFCVKVPKIITHEFGLVGAQGLMEEFVGTVRELGEKLGVILLQFPPSFTADQLPVLDTFLAKLPWRGQKGIRYAIEIRDRSWYTAVDSASDLAGVEAVTVEMLQRYGVCWAATEYPRVPGRINITTNFLYIRWIGQHGSYQNHDHERVDQSPELGVWWYHLQKKLRNLEAVFGFFNNDYAGFAPGTANRFKEIVGLPHEPLLSYQQPRLL